MLTSWSPFFQSPVRMRGRAYVNSNKIERVAPEAGELVRAQVQGQNTYTVVIRRDAGRAEAECTCPYFEGGSYCKHIWATLLHIQEHPDESGASSEELAALPVRAPKARKRSEDGPRPARASEPEWLGRLSLLRPPAYDREEAALDTVLDRRQICYVLLPEASQRHGNLVVELRQRTPGVNGWSKPRPMKISAANLQQLADPVDRELCALILGATQLGEYETGATTSGWRSHARYRLPAGAWRCLLQRMVSTERCFVDLDEAGQGREQLLQWDGDQAWVLWMVGESARFSEEDQADDDTPAPEAEPDELLVTVQLRRDDRRLSVERPVLLLGGPDGILVADGKAAPFDDRDALRWASHFRDEYRRREELRPIRVPRQDVDRFLDRLYMLPQIPEIDLPPGVGRVPQHVKPQPHLDLYSPGSTEAAQLLPASAKNQLLARVWFDYANQRVVPGQPGRFVTISSAASRTDEPHAPEPADHAQPAADDPPNQAPGEVLAQPDPEPAQGQDAAILSLPQDGLLIRRDTRGERQALANLATMGLRPVGNGTPDALVLPAKQMPQAVSTLIADGWHISADQRALRQAARPSLSIASGMDWFELRGGVRYERDDGQTQEVPLPEILAAVRSGQSMISLGDGSKGLLPEQWLQEHGLLTTLARVHKDHLRFKNSQAAMLDALLSEQELVSVDADFQQLRQRLHQFKGILPLEASDQFQGSLRPYQKLGLGWMAFLRFFGMGGILADDMGLGKTIQVLAVIQARKIGLEPHCDPPRHHDGEQTGRTHRPTLVVAPRSVVFNWIDEAERFTPELRVLAYTGAEREAQREAFDQHDIVVTSYGLLRRDIQELREYPFDYAILDEAQAIKNPASQAAKAARLLQANHRLALTGTPVENHLGDLWSIFEYLNPGMLGSGSRFGELVRATNGNGPANGNGGTTPNANAPSTQSIEQVGKALRPFILRRTKKQVLHDLPEKTEQTIVCEMEPEQRKIYDQLRDYYRSHLFKQLDGTHADTHYAEAKQRSVIGGNAGFMVLEALLRLRQAACHPALIDGQDPDAPSAKLDVLLELLGDVIEEGSKALIFSQFTSMLALVRKQLDDRGIRYCYLDGQTRNRREIVHQFQEDADIPLFLLSLKTGGFGINLTAAEYVFILDPWWNPAVEQQAIDRTHRIGQTQRVFAYRLVCQDTVEQRISQLQQQKRQIAEAVVGGEQNVLRHLTREDLEKLLS